MMIRGIMVVLVLCMMSLISAHPQQSLSPNQSLRAEARFVEAKGFKSQLEAWRASAKLKYCAIRAVVKKAGEKQAATEEERRVHTKARKEERWEQQHQERERQQREQGQAHAHALCSCRCASATEVRSARPTGCARSWCGAA